jgi:hypothetical protein
MASRRRGQNEGSIYQRKDGRWAAAFSTGDGWQHSEVRPQKLLSNAQSVKEGERYGQQ